MEQDEDTSTMSPFWVPNDNRRRLRRSYSMFLTSTSFLVLLLVIALVFGLIILPTLHSFTSNIFKPNAVKHSWDSLNLILVLFAVVCGFLTKNDTNETKTPRFDNYNHQRSFSNPSTPTSWYEHNNRSFNRLRSFGSYPDLRQYSPVVADDDRYRFYDDTNLFLRNRRFRLDGEEEFVASGEVSASPVRLPEMKPPLTSQPEAVRRNDEETSQTETIEEHDLVAENSKPPPPPPMPAVRKKKREIATKDNAATVTSASPVMKSDPEPQPPPSAPPPPQVMRTKAVRRNANTKRTYRAEMTEKLENEDFFAVNSQPPPQPPSPPSLHTERKTDMQVKKKRGSATKEFLTSLKGKKKKQRQRSVENFETLLRNSQQVSQQPPPPPPPPPSVFQNLLSFNKSKYKTHYHVPMASHKPKLPNKREHSYYSLEDNVNVMTTGNESPLIPIPPPPPPPPFKLPAWKFRVQGDYVRVDSIGSSRSSSPDIDEAMESPTSQEDTSQCNSNTNSPYAPKCEDHVTETSSASAAFCPSPDVDTKAQNFIKNFRAGLRIAKMNSMKEKQGIGRSKLSNLGPLQNP